MAFASITGGNTATSAASTSTLVVSNFGATIPIGSIVFAVIGKDNTSTTADGDNSEVTSVTDTAGNTWVKVAEESNVQTGAGTGATVALWKSNLTAALTTTVGSKEVTFNFAACTAKAGILGAFSVASGNDVRTVGTIQRAATDGAALPSQTISGLPSKEYLFIRVSACEGPTSSPTAGTNYSSLMNGGSVAVGTAGGSSATNMSVLAAYRIFTGTGDSNNATNGSTDSASLYIAFEEFATVTTHAATGALTGPGSTIAGTAAHIAIHGTTGALTGSGSTFAGTAAHIAIHGATGALTGPGSTVAGSAARTAIHATTGILTGPGSTVAGTSVHNIPHATSGAIVGPGSTIVGAAVYNAKHATSGALTGAGSVVVGVAARMRAHATTGVLTGPGTVVAGTAVYNAKHTTSGALTGSGSTLAGSATRFRTFATSGVIVGSGSMIAGAALRGIISTTHATSGALVGQPSIIDGTARRTRQHATSGIITGPPAFIVGVVTRWRGHDSSGALLGVTGVVFGRAFNGTPQLHDIPVDSDNLVNEPSPPSEGIGASTVLGGQIVNHPLYPAA